MVRLGSSAACELTLADPEVRPQHCVLRCSRGQVALVVTNAAAKVYVKGDAVREKTLRQGDLVRVGDTEIRVHIDGKDPFVGKTLAGYRLEQRLGHGATGTVYKAKQLSIVSKPWVTA